MKWSECPMAPFASKAAVKTSRAARSAERSARWGKGLGLAGPNGCASSLSSRRSRAWIAAAAAWAARTMGAHEPLIAHEIVLRDSPTRLDLSDVGFEGRAGQALREVLGQLDGVGHGRSAPLLHRVAIGQDSLGLDSPRAAGGQRDDRPERQFLQVLGGVIRDDHLRLNRLGIDPFVGQNQSSQEVKCIRYDLLTYRRVAHEGRSRPPVTVRG